MNRLAAIVWTICLTCLCHAGEPSVWIPREKLGKPLLFGSRIVHVNRAYGKVFSDGQRNPRPLLVGFETDTASQHLRLVPLRHETADGMRMRGEGGGRRRHAFVPVRFPILEERPEGYRIDLSEYFSTYPEAISAIPPKILDGRAEEHEITEISETSGYLQVTGRYRYASGLDVTAACYLIYLKEQPMRPRTVNSERVGYNSVEFRPRRGGRNGFSQRWDLSGGRKIRFYVDRRFPAEWYPYIREGIEDWNRCFEKIGLGSVLEVFPEPENPDRTFNGPLVNRVRFMDVDEANAKGDVMLDPRSGEILQGDILWWRDVVSLMCDWRYVQTGAADPQARLEEYPVSMLGPMIRHAVCHETGHVLGLGHNMGASWAYPSDSLHSVTFTRQYGTCASVMDYARYNHLATPSEVTAGVSLLPPRTGPYDEYAIACGYGDDPDPEPGPYCYFAPFISAAISPDPSSQAESLGDDLLRSCRAGVSNCCTLLYLDGLTPKREKLLRRYYYRYISLALSDIGGITSGQPVGRRNRNQALAFIMQALAEAPAPLFDAMLQQNILDELVGNFLPERVYRNEGERGLKQYYGQLKKLHRKYPALPLKGQTQWKRFN